MIDTGPPHEATGQRLHAGDSWVSLVEFLHYSRAASRGYYDTASPEDTPILEGVHVSSRGSVGRCFIAIDPAEDIQVDSSMRKVFLHNRSSRSNSTCNPLQLHVHECFLFKSYN